MMTKTKQMMVWVCLGLAACKKPSPVFTTCQENAEIQKERFALSKQVALYQKEKQDQQAKLQEMQAKKMSYYQTKIAEKILLNTEERRKKVAALKTWIVELVQDPTEAARLENELYSAIRMRSEKWLEQFNYQPLDSSMRIISPVKALYLWKKMGMEWLRKKTVKDAKEVLEILQFNFGDEAGDLLMQMEPDRLEKLLHEK